MATHSLSKIQTSILIRGRTGLSLLHYGGKLTAPKSVSRYELSGENATELTKPEWPLRVWRSVPLAGSQSLTVLSHEADASSCLSVENATELTGPEWPSRVWCSALLVGSQSLTVSSSEADANSCPSVENATELTGPE